MINVGIRFRVIENNQKLFDTDPIPIIGRGAAMNRDKNIDDIVKGYSYLREKHPKAEIIVIHESVHWETYEPLTKLLEEDIAALSKKADTSIRNGIFVRPRKIEE